MVNNRRRIAAQAANNEAIRHANEYEARETDVLINYLERRLDIALNAEEKAKIRNRNFRYLRYELNRIKDELSTGMSNFYLGEQGEQISIIPMYQEQVRNLINGWNENRERQAQEEFNQGEEDNAIAAMLEQYNQYEGPQGGKRKTRKTRKSRKSRKTHRRRASRRHRK